MTLDAKLKALECAAIRAAQSLPETEYLFRHLLVQDAVYRPLLKATRRDLRRASGDAAGIRAAQLPARALAGQLAATIPDAAARGAYLGSVLQEIGA